MVQWSARKDAIARTRTDIGRRCWQEANAASGVCAPQIPPLGQPVGHWLPEAFRPAGTRPLLAPISEGGIGDLLFGASPNRT